MTNELYLVKDCEGYFITENGELYSNRKSSRNPDCKIRQLSPGLNSKGYLTVSIYCQGKLKGYTIHRLVALTFIPNPDNKPQVNHKDGNKLNNHVSNLEWATNDENNKHSWDNNLRPNIRKPIQQYTLDGSFVAEYISITEGSKQTKIERTNISRCCIGTLRMAGNYLWRYKNVG